MQLVPTKSTQCRRRKQVCAKFFYIGLERMPMAVKYQMIAKELEVMLLSGKGGGKLPTEGELCQQYG